MKAVLCALDFNEVSSTVLEVAMEMALLFKAHLTILFSYRLIDHQEMGNISELKSKIEGEARNRFNDLEQKVLTHHPGVSYEFRTEIGFLSDRIENFTRKNQVGMIVIGQQLAENINEHKGLSLHDFISGVKLPVVLVPEELNVAEFLHE